MDIKKYYSRKDVQSELLRISKDREVQIWINEIRGKRPDTIQYIKDIDSFVKQGMTSFHISEERWHNPLNLKAGMSKRELDDMRKGWDLILDIDSKNLEYSKITAELILDALKFHDVKNFSLKFSGNHGFHIGIPFETFPKKLNEEDVNLLFPDLVRNVASYLKYMIKPFLSEKILKIDSIESIAKELNKKQGDLIENDIFNPFSVVDIDSILISSRHMFRAPYSLNEKSGLVSIPIGDMKKFNIEDAKPENVKIELKFLELENIKVESSKNLLIQSYDYMIKKEEIKSNKNNFENRPFILTKRINEESFPPCIKNILNGIKSDGRKRSLFVLTNFLNSINYDFKEIGDIISKWNSKNYQPLKEGYIRTQLEWYKKQNQKVLPSNCSNEVYYKSIGVCVQDNLCRLVKNPVNYAIRKSSLKIKK